MKGFRADFYNADAALRSIEILEWAAEQSAFLASDVRAHFAGQLVGYKDADHEISERLRKLLKSGNIVVVTSAYVSAELAAGRLGGQEASEMGLHLDQIQAGGSRGRKPRLYALSQAGRRYLSSRAEDEKNGTAITSRADILVSGLTKLINAVRALQESDGEKAQARAAGTLFKVCDEAEEAMEKANGAD